MHKHAHATSTDSKQKQGHRGVLGGSVPKEEKNLDSLHSARVEKGTPPKKKPNKEQLRARKADETAGHVNNSVRAPSCPIYRGKGRLGRTRQPRTARDEQARGCRASDPLGPAHASGPAGRRARETEKETGESPGTAAPDCISGPPRLPLTGRLALMPS